MSLCVGVRVCERESLCVSLCARESVCLRESLSV